MAAKPGDVYDHDETISPETKVLRRIPPDKIVEGDPNQRPQSGNFSNHRNGTGTSVSIWVEGTDPLNLLAEHEGFGVVSLTVRDIRDAGLGIIRAQSPDDPHHAHIQGKKTSAARRGLAEAAVWIRRPADTNR